MIVPKRCALIVLACVFAAAAAPRAQVTFDRLVRAAQEPHNWLSYSGGYFSQRYSELAQITPENARNLELAWVYQLNSREPTSTRFEATPLVVDGIMYIVQAPNDIVALDAAERQTVLDLFVHPVAAGAPLLRPGESRRGDTRRSAVHGHHRRPSGRGRREKRPARSGTRPSCRPEAGYAFTLGSAGREGQGDRRSRRR